MLHQFLVLYAVRLPIATTDADFWLDDLTALVCQIQLSVVSLGDGRPDASSSRGMHCPWLSISRLHGLLFVYLLSYPLSKELSEHSRFSLFPSDCVLLRII